MGNHRNFPISACLRQLTVLGLFLLLSGCGDKLTSVSGIVRLDGKPVAAASVALHPVNGGPIAIGTTDAEGRYRLESGSRPGVMQSEYRVTVSKSRVLGIGKDERVLPGGIKTEYIVPAIYNNPATSPLHFTVGSDVRDFDIELKSAK